MNLSLLQGSLLNIIKSRGDLEGMQDEYLQKVIASPNLNLAKKTINWWRKIQVQNYCILTANLLNAYGLFDKAVAEFTKIQFSAFRDQVGLEFFDFVVKHHTAPLVKAVCCFERALIKLRTGTEVEETIAWPCEPFAVIQALLDNTFDKHALQAGNYEVVVSKTFGQQLFKVYELVSEQAVDEIPAYHAIATTPVSA